MTPPARTITPDRRIRLERTFQATLEDVWQLWTTKEGIESWWGPEGFSVQVRTLDLRPGGLLQYAMTATAPSLSPWSCRSIDTPGDHQMANAS